jgi:hypothetical protein
MFSALDFWVAMAFAVAVTIVLMILFDWICGCDDYDDWN